MLVLSRKQNERIRVGDSVVVTIVRVSGDKVRIGIEAPPEMRVLRDELQPTELLVDGRGGITVDAGASMPVSDGAVASVAGTPLGRRILRLAAAG
ncbi:MAG: carbon storage regulator [Planctomycetaceae bacterium]